VLASRARHAALPSSSLVSPLLHHSFWRLHAAGRDRFHKGIHGDVPRGVVGIFGGDGAVRSKIKRVAIVGVDAVRDQS